MNLHRLAGIVIGCVTLSCGDLAVANNDLTLTFTPDPLRVSGITHEGCFLEPGEARGVLAVQATHSRCHSGLFGVAVAAFTSDPADPEIYPVATFTSAPMASRLALAGPVSIRVYYTDEIVGSTNIDGQQTLGYELKDLRPDGSVELIGAGIAISNLVNYGAFGAGGPADGFFDVGAYILEAGSRLRLHLLLRNQVDSSARLLFGGPSLYPASVPIPDFSDAGITLALAGESTDRASAQGGSPTAVLWLGLLLAAFARQRLGFKRNIRL